MLRIVILAVRTRIFPLGYLLPVLLAGCAATKVVAPPPAPPAGIEFTEMKSIVERFVRIGSLRMDADVALTVGDTVLPARMHLAYLRQAGLRAAFTQRGDDRLGVLCVDEGGIRESYPDQKIRYPLGKPPQPGPWPPHPPYLRKLINLPGYLSPADELARVLTGHPIPTPADPPLRTLETLLGPLHVYDWAQGTVLSLGRVDFDPIPLAVSYTPRYGKGALRLRYGSFAREDTVPVPRTVRVDRPEEAWSLEITFTRLEVNADVTAEEIRASCSGR